MLTAKQVAEYFLLKSEPDFGDTITNLKLQKLVYYAQGFYLAMFDEKIFEDNILAWEHGPVVESLYHEYKKYGSGEIPQPTDFDYANISTKQRGLLDEVYQVYGQFSAWKLRNMTHSEKPWIETPLNEIIKPEIMQSFFKDYIN